MPTRRIIAVEGITGVGKSHAGQLLALGFSGLGLRARWHFELSPTNPVVPARHDASVLEAALEKWQEFLAQEPTHDEVCILDGRLFHIGAVVALKNGVSPEAIAAGLDRLARLAERHGVESVFLTPSSVEALFDNTFARRNSDAWYVDHTEASAFCRERGLSGRAAVVAFYREVDRLLAAAFATLASPVLTLRVPVGRWEVVLPGLERFFGFELPRSPSEDPAVLALAGRYVDAQTGWEYEFARRGEALAAVNHPYRRFQPVEQVWTLRCLERDTYVAMGQPVQLVFERERGAVVRVVENGTTVYLKDQS